MNKILIVEDDFELAEKLKLAFEDRDTLTMSCSSIRVAKYLMMREQFAIVLLDSKPSDGNGFDFLREIKKNQEKYNKNGVSVIMFVSNDSKWNIINAVEQGADDCITKPFSTAALKAKVGTQLQRKKKEPNFEASECFDAIGVASRKGISGEHIVFIDQYIFDFDNKKFHYKDELIELSTTEQVLLRILVENKGVVLKRAALMERMKTEMKECIDVRMLADLIKMLCKKLRAVDYIKTVYGIGYFWADKVEGHEEK